MTSFKEFLKETVVKGDFGKGPKNPDIEIPKGYKSFYVKKISDNVAHIIGVKEDGKEVKISAAPPALANALVKEYNSGGKSKTGLQKMSLMQAFGSEALNIAHDLGIKLQEKPESFYDLQHYPIGDTKLKKLEKEFKKYGMQLNTYDSTKIFGHPYKKDDDELRVDTSRVKNRRFSPVENIVFKPEERMFIVKFANGNRYLVDLSGANTYIRNWVFIG